MMPSPNDWRRRDQETYLKGAELVLSSYSQPREGWDHDHCEFCWAKFMLKGKDGTLSEGYKSADGQHWICEQCFQDFKDEFEWSITQSVV